ncbi:hypothetical protein D3C87_2077700 [compost metagenome]
MEDDEIGMPAFLTDGDVIPAQVVVIQLCLQTLGEASLSTGHARSDRTQRGNQRGHALLLFLLPVQELR